MYLCSSLFRYCDKNKSNEKGRIPSEEADLNFRDAKKFYRTPIIIKSLRPLRPLRAETKHPCGGYISHAKSAENAEIIIITLMAGLGLELSSIVIKSY